MARGSAFVLHSVADSRREGLDVDPPRRRHGGGSGRTTAAPRAVAPVRITPGRRFPHRASHFPFSRLGGVRRESGEEK